MQGLLPGLLPSDLFSTPTQVSTSNMQYRNAKAEIEQQVQSTLDAIFADLEDDLLPPQRPNNTMQQHENDSVDTYDQVHSPRTTQIQIAHKQQPQSRPQPKKG